MKKKDLISIIITTKNEADLIGNLLSSIFKQTYKNIEVLLIDNSSQDKTLEIAKKFDVKIYTFGPERSAQRNFGAKKSKGEYFLFLDADMELTPRVLESCSRMVKTDKFAGIVIPEKSVGKNFWGKVKAFERSFYNSQGDLVTDAARFFLKRVFFEIGGYDESITGPEDWDLHDRIKEKGLKFGRIREKIYHHEGKISLFDLFNKKFYYGLNAHKYLSKHKIFPISPKTIYLFRPVFFTQADRFIEHPLLSLGLFFMLSLELIAGGLGYLIGRLNYCEAIK